jgi:molecular chaperone DnaK
MSTVIGIDLGTTNTVVAVVRDGHAAALADEAGNTLLPSVVSFHPNGNVLVGRGAKERRLQDSSNTVYSIKRLIGRSWDSEEVRRARDRFPFQMKEGPGQAALVVARGESYTLPEISAFVLRKAKSIAEAALGTSVERAVITVPANFNDLQRAATKVAGRVAGLEVTRILNEPTAAALAYGYGKSSSERIAVYDFGGGTFDVTLLDLSNNVFEVLATAGNTFLGGDDLDLLIADRMCEVLLSRQRFDAKSDSQVFERLRLAAETIKHELSSKQEARVSLPEVAHGAGGKPINFDFSMTRAEFERLAQPIIDRTFDVCREALGIARLSQSDFDNVLLVGGSTRVPLVRKRVEDFFRKPLKANINPDEVVAIGAAIQAAALSGAERRKATVPPAPSPAARQSQASLADARTMAARGRLDTAPGIGDIPSTQPFFGRPHLPTQPGSNRPPGVTTESTLGALGRTPTLGGLGARGRVRTGPGLGPEAAKAVSGPTLVSASEQALRAREAANESLGLPLVDARTETPQPALDPAQIAARYGNLPLIMPDAQAAKTREESIAFALADAEFDEVTSVPPPADFDEDALPIPEVPDEEPTRVGTATLSSMQHSLAATQQMQAAPQFAAAPPPPPRAPAPTPPVAAPTPFAPPPGLFAPPPPPAPPAASPYATAPFEPVPVPKPRSIPPQQAPLLIDVTPLTLAVETVNGFCDGVIARNSKVPCEHTRDFVTAADNQTAVRVRISQGESSRFGDNTLLGEVELGGLRPAARGEVQIAVTFALDTNGMLNVSAKEVATGKATSAQVRLVAMPDASDVSWMAARNASRQM